MSWQSLLDKVAAANDRYDQRRGRTREGSAAWALESGIQVAYKSVIEHCDELMAATSDEVAQMTLKHVRDWCETTRLAIAIDAA